MAYTADVPVVFRYRGYTVFFFSNEGDPREPVHVHVRGGGALAKFWIEPAVALAENYGFSAVQLRDVEALVREHTTRIVEAWYEHFGH